MFIGETKNEYKFLFKASLAYGPIIHGRDIPDETNRQFIEVPGYKDSILIGLPMIQAFTHEKLLHFEYIFMNLSTCKWYLWKM